jgi:hypothetical protein
MSFYLRSTVKVGPFRCSLSKSGIGVSAGIPGLRIGASPRGTYVRVGAAGVYTYATSSSSGRRGTPAVVAPPLPPVHFQPGDVVLQDVTGATSMEMRPSKPSELLRSLNEAASRRVLWPWVAVFMIVLALAASPYVLVAGVPAIGVAVWRDRVRRSVVAFYEVDGPQHGHYQRLVDHFQTVCESRMAWHTVAQGRVVTPYQRKVNAGASSLIRREALTRSYGGPPHMASNIAIPTMQSSSRSIFLLPDRVLVKDGTVYAELGYSELSVADDLQRFIEDGRVPSDGTVVGTTWKFVNKNGGPDRRFKDNRQLPVMHYSRVRLASPAGMNTLLSFSDARAAAVLARSVRAMPTPQPIALPTQRQIDSVPIVPVHPPIVAPHLQYRRPV